MGLGLSPSLAAKAGVIALTSLPESIKTLTLGWSFWNWTGYRMQGTRCRGPILASELALTDVEVAETAAIFLLWEVQCNWWNNVPSYRSSSR